MANSRSLLDMFGHTSTEGDALRDLHFNLGDLIIDEKKAHHHWLVDSWWFNGIVTATVILNTIQLGLEADYPDHKEIWRICENVVTGIFVVEMITKTACLRCLYFHDSANLMDASLTLLGVMDCWIFTYMAGNIWDLQSMSILRILRLFRLIRIAKIASRIRPLVLVLSGLYHALKTTFWVFLVFIIVIYVFAVFCTEYIGRGNVSLYPGYSTEETIIDAQEVMASFNPYLVFGSMSASMLTLFNIAIGGEWQEIIRPLAIKQPFFVFLFLSYCVVIVFGIMNVIIAIVVDNVILESKRQDHVVENALREARKNLLEQIQQVILGMDTNYDGVIDKNELKEAFDSHPEFRELLEKCDLPAGWTHHEMLAVLDNSGDGVLQHEEFTTNLFRLLDGDVFQKICVVQASLNQLKHLVRQAHEKLEIHVAEVKQSIRHLRAFANFSTDHASIIINNEIKADTELDGAHGMDDDDMESITLGSHADAPPRTRRSTGSELQQLSDSLTFEQGTWWRDQDLGKGIEQPNAARKSTASASEDPFFTQASAARQELRQDVGSLAYKRIVDIFDASVVAMKKSFRIELALLVEGEEMPTGSQQDAQQDVWNIREELTRTKALLEVKIEEAKQLSLEKVSIQLALDSYEERHTSEMNDIADWKLLANDVSNELRSEMVADQEVEDMDIGQEVEAAITYVTRAPGSLSPLRSATHNMSRRAPMSKLSLRDSAHQGTLSRDITSRSILSSDEGAQQKFPSRDSTYASTRSSSAQASPLLFLGVAEPLRKDAKLV